MNYRATLIKLFTFLGGLYFFLEFVLPEQFLGVEFGRYDEQITDGFRVIGAMTFGLGLINLLSIHGTRLLYLRRGWVNSVALLLGLGSMILVTSLDWAANARIASQVQDVTVLRDFGAAIRDDAAKNRTDVPPVLMRNESLLNAFERQLQSIESAVAEHDAAAPSMDARQAALFRNTQRDLREQVGISRAAVERVRAKGGLDAPGAIAESELPGLIAQLGGTWRQFLTLVYEVSGTKMAYRVLFEGLFVSLGSAMFSLLGFYIASAAYRAFRIRSAESALMMVAALVVMLGQIPFGIYLWDGFPEVRLWLLSVPSAAARRAIEIGAAVAGLVMAFRMWFSIESESFGEKKQ